MSRRAGDFILMYNIIATLAGAPDCPTLCPLHARTNSRVVSHIGCRSRRRRAARALARAAPQVAATHCGGTWAYIGRRKFGRPRCCCSHCRCPRCRGPSYHCLNHSRSPALSPSPAPTPALTPLPSPSPRSLLRALCIVATATRGDAWAVCLAHRVPRVAWRPQRCRG